MQGKGCGCTVPGPVRGIDRWVFEAGKSKCKLEIDRLWESTVTGCYCTAFSQCAQVSQNSVSKLNFEGQFSMLW